MVKQAVMFAVLSVASTESRFSSIPHGAGYCTGLPASAYLLAIMVIAVSKQVTYTGKFIMRKFLDIVFFVGQDRPALIL